eukprot:COSAG05_NODE_198_length_14502_cov_41.134416_3_plen_109_part_00
MAATGHRTATPTNARVHIEPPHPYGVHFLGPSGASSGVCAARYFGREVIRRRSPWGRGPSQGPRPLGRRPKALPCMMVYGGPYTVIQGMVYKTGLISSYNKAAPTSYK